MLAKLSGLPAPFGNTSPAALGGHTLHHSVSVFRTTGGSRIARRELADFGLPITPFSSARWVTVSCDWSRSMSAHRRPRSSLARRPVKTAVIRNGRQLLRGRGQ